MTALSPRFVNEADSAMASLAQAPGLSVFTSVQRHETVGLRAGGLPKVLSIGPRNDCDHMWYNVDTRGNMRERKVGIRELKSKLSECVRDVKMGATIVVTEHGRSVARIVPEARSLDERLDTLRNAGTILWSGRRLGAGKPGAPVRGKRMVADIVVENRG